MPKDVLPFGFQYNLSWEECAKLGERTAVVFFPNEGASEARVFDSFKDRIGDSQVGASREWQRFVPKPIDLSKSDLLLENFRSEGVTRQFTSFSLDILNQKLSGIFGGVFTAAGECSFEVEPGDAYVEVRSICRNLVITDNSDQGSPRKIAIPGECFVTFCVKGDANGCYSDTPLQLLASNSIIRNLYVLDSKDSNILQLLHLSPSGVAGIATIEETLFLLIAQIEQNTLSRLKPETEDFSLAEITATRVYVIDLLNKTDIDVNSVRKACAEVGSFAELLDDKKILQQIERLYSFFEERMFVNLDLFASGIKLSKLKKPQNPSAASSSSSSVAASGVVIKSLRSGISLAERMLVGFNLFAGIQPSKLKKPQNPAAASSSSSSVAASRVVLERLRAGISSAISFEVLWGRGLKKSFLETHILKAFQDKSYIMTVKMPDGQNIESVLKKLPVPYDAKFIYVIVNPNPYFAYNIYICRSCGNAQGMESIFNSTTHGIEFKETFRSKLSLWVNEIPSLPGCSSSEAILIEGQEIDVVNRSMIDPSTIPANVSKEDKATILTSEAKSKMALGAMAKSIGFLQIVSTELGLEVIPWNAIFPDAIQEQQIAPVKARFEGGAGVSLLTNIYKVYPNFHLLLLFIFNQNLSRLTGGAIVATGKPLATFFCLPDKKFRIEISFRDIVIQGNSSRSGAKSISMPGECCITLDVNCVVASNGDYELKFDQIQLLASNTVLSNLFDENLDVASLKLLLGSDYLDFAIIQEKLFGFIEKVAQMLQTKKINDEKLRDRFGLLRVDLMQKLQERNPNFMQIQESAVVFLECIQKLDFGKMELSAQIAELNVMLDKIKSDHDQRASEKAAACSGLGITSARFFALPPSAFEGVPPPGNPDASSSSFGNWLERTTEKLQQVQEAMKEERDDIGKEASVLFGSVVVVPPVLGAGAPPKVEIAVKKKGASTTLKSPTPPPVQEVDDSKRSLAPSAATPASGFSAAMRTVGNFGDRLLGSTKIAGRSAIDRLGQTTVGLKVEKVVETAKEALGAAAERAKVREVVNAAGAVFNVASETAKTVVTAATVGSALTVKHVIGAAGDRGNTYKPGETRSFH